MSKNAGDEDRTVARSGSSVPGREAAASAGSNAGPGDGGDAHALPVGTRLNEFELTRRIGEGGFSIVYLAWDHSLDRKVALKEYMPGALASRVGDTLIRPRSERHRETFEAGLKSFINEAKLLARFDHPALVKVYRFWEANGTAYLVMPLYEGVTLKDAVRAMSQPPDEDWLRGLLAPLTDALNVIHAEHCYHRDIAPDNIMLLADGGKPLLLDFGAARRVIGDMTQALTVILKPGYAPVEQYAEVPGMKQGPWTDVYALAATVYWMVLGRTPPPSVGRMLADSYEPLSQAAAGRFHSRFLSAIDSALAVLPERRTQTIDALRADLGLGDVAAPPDAERLADPEATVIRAQPPVRQAGPGASGSSDSSASAPLRAETATSVSTNAADGLAEGPAHTGSRRLRIGLGIGLAACAALIGAGWWALKPPPSPVTARGAQPAPTTAPTAVTTPAKTEPRSPAEAIRQAMLGASPARSLSARTIRRGSTDTVDAAEIGTKDRWGLSVTSSASGYLYVFAARGGEATLRLLWPARLEATDRRDSGRFDLDLGVLRPPLDAGRWSLLVLMSQTPRDLSAAGWREDGAALVRGFDVADGPAAAPAWGKAICASGSPGCEDLFGANELSVTIVELSAPPPPVAPLRDAAPVKPVRPAVSRSAGPNDSDRGIGSDAASAGKRKAETPAPDAECARIYQRLSLGESTAELMARAKALRCR